MVGGLRVACGMRGSRTSGAGTGTSLGDRFVEVWCQQFESPKNRQSFWLAPSLMLE